jgi:pyridoxal phosphate enzyme (YggS family)
MALVQAWQTVLARIDSAAKAAGRDPAEIQLLAVSKTFPVAEVATLYQAGQSCFGENYVQELAEKAEALPDVSWHFIGPLQSNKTRAVAEIASWVHSVEREKILQRLSAQRPDTLPALNICLEVNVSGEESKSGVSPEAVIALARASQQYPNLCLRGLMCIPEPTGDEAKLRAQFAQLRQLYESLQQAGYTTVDTLSMGMTQDLEIAIAEGATIVRVGTAIFGARTRKV